MPAGSAPAAMPAWRSFARAAERGRFSLVPRLTRAAMLPQPGDAFSARSASMPDRRRAPAAPIPVPARPRYPCRTSAEHWPQSPHARPTIPFRPCSPPTRWAILLQKEHSPMKILVTADLHLDLWQRAGRGGTHRRPDPRLLLEPRCLDPPPPPRSLALRPYTSAPRRAGRKHAGRQYLPRLSRRDPPRRRGRHSPPRNHRYRSARSAGP